MNLIKKLAFIIFSLFLLSFDNVFSYDVLTNGSKTVSPPPIELINKADYGKEPTNYKEIIHAYFYKIAIDPTSVLFRDWLIFKDWAYDYKNKQYIFGYSVCVYVNAKNKFGGYTGWELWWFFIRDNKLYVHTLQPNIHAHAPEIADVFKSVKSINHKKICQGEPPNPIFGKDVILVYQEQ